MSAPVAGTQGQGPDSVRHPQSRLATDSVDSWWSSTRSPLRSCRSSMSASTVILGCAIFAVQRIEVYETFGQNSASQDTLWEAAIWLFKRRYCPSWVK